jgi:hypothetical protein
MIIDALLEFSKSQALTAAAASTNVVDLGQAAPTPGMVGVLDLVVTVASAVKGTLQVKLQDCDTESGTFADVLSGATLTAPEEGTQIVLRVPQNTKRYLRAYFGGAPTAGTVNAALVWGSDNNVPPAQAESIQSLY